MFDRFGEFDSAQEINEAAAAQLAEGDTEAVYAIAEENGIDAEEADDFINGDVGELTNPLMAALGKLDLEEAELKPHDIMADWLEIIRVRCQEDSRMAAAVRKKGKSLEGCYGALLRWSYENSREVDKRIVRAAGIQVGRITEGTPRMARAKQIITEYYLGK
ncbi:MAG: hypothetical protein K2O16_03245 [Lachnospiraceae bacterium]|nr:hypothetical protein [Lachnospiraceae bacterium]